MKTDDIGEMLEEISRNGKGQFIHTLNDLAGEIKGNNLRKANNIIADDVEMLESFREQIWNSFPQYQADYKSHLIEMSESRRRLEKLV